MSKISQSSTFRPFEDMLQAIWFDLDGYHMKANIATETQMRKYA